MLPRFEQLLFLCFLLVRPAFAQENITFEDDVYDPLIRSVQLYRDIYETSYPVIHLGQSLPLTLEFDELISQDEQASEFLIDIISCTANWEPSNVLPIEFFEGFTQNRITNLRRSRHTKVPYVHYTYTFPQQGQGFKMSGNYLLKVYRDNAEEEIVLTRRFIVVEQRTEIQLINLLLPLPERLPIDQLTFALQTKGLPLRNTFQDLKLKLLQNFRWDNAYTFEAPRFQSPDKLEYYVNLEQAFEGGNEFRFHDIRSLQFFSNSVREVLEREEVFDVVLYRDNIRTKNTLGPIRDLNGSFYIRHSNFPDGDIHADYVYNLFALSTPPIEGAHVYLNGAFTDWQLKEEYRMEYNSTQRQYELDLLLKQGFYDYQYILQKGSEQGEGPLEGRHRNSENFYTLLVYFRSPMDRTDRIVGFQAVNYVD